jgi:ATP-binding cassette subfamily A (ABC1) protein 3
MEILNELNSTFNSSHYSINLRRYPFPPYKADNFVLVIQVWFPFLLVMSYIFAAINTVKNIVYEKEKGLKVCRYKRTISNKMNILGCYDYNGS